MRLLPFKLPSLTQLLSIFVLILGCHLSFAAPINRNPGIPDDIPADIKSLLNDQALSGSISGIMVVDLKDGSTFYERNENTRLIPASSRKLFTSAAALELLGDSFTIPTVILADEHPDANGVIAGNLYIKGGGDARLSTDDLAAFVSELKAAGVKEITGNIVGDSTLFTDGPYPEGWGVDYLSDDYAMQIAALELNEGCIGAAVQVGSSVGASPKVTLTPDTDYIPVVDTCTTVAADGVTNVVIQRPYNKNELDVSGTIKLGDSIPLDTYTVDNPALFCTTVLAQKLAAAGIKIDGKAVLGAAPTTASKLEEHDSAPMSEYIRLMNKPSDNLQAECLVRILGAVKGTAGTFTAGSVVEEAFFASCGINSDELIFADGSGVSRLDQVSAHAMVKLLVAMAGKPDFQVYYDSLPIAGIDGTLKKRMVGTPAAGNAHAKTGSVRFCHTIGGYVKDKAGHMLAFSLLNNNFYCPVPEVNRIQDSVINKLVEVK
jgi:D-alanyl-D-alanine carboxypeptidase/D-alanyl-D-alanine-endopeptidase (penicillin-binding protein 4)